MRFRGGGIGHKATLSHLHELDDGAHSLDAAEEDMEEIESEDASTSEEAPEDDEQYVDDQEPVTESEEEETDDEDADDVAADTDTDGDIGAEDGEKECKSKCDMLGFDEF